MNLSLHKSFQKDEDCPSVIRLLKYTPPVEESLSCLAVLDIFHENSSIFAIPVVNRDLIPSGIVERHAFIEKFIKPYTKEIHGKKSISEFMNPSPIIVDKETSIDDIARIVIDAGMQHMVSGFIATDNGLYIGIANGHDLLNEITHRKQANLFHLAHFDQLTKLPNRVLFMDRLDMAVKEATRHQTRVGLLFIDLDNFKHFNDSMGHGFGDKLLIAVAECLSACARETDTVARLSGDEFTIMLENVNSPNELDILCERILETMKQPMQIMGREVFISASIGKVIYPDDDAEASGLLVKADAAMYEAKRSGRSTFRHYAEGMNIYSFDHMTLENELRMAVERKEFRLYYQPKVDMTDGEIVGVEALIRWIHPDRGMIPPLEFLPIIEGSPLEISVGDWVIAEALNQLDIWLELGLNLQVSVNISPLHLQAVGFFTNLQSELSRHPNINPHQLQLEVLETSVLADLNTVSTVIKACRDELGVSVALDDFGTGYSSLTHLRHLPTDTIKIDQTFVRDMIDDPNDFAIVDGVIGLAQAFRREVIAEGVETRDHGLMLLTLGCKLAQGYGIARPMPAEAIDQWVKNYCPDAKWLNYARHPLTQNEARVMQVIIQNHHWKMRLEKCLNSPEGTAEHWPIMNHEECHWGRWADYFRREKLFDAALLNQLNEVHIELHRNGNDVKQMYLIGKIDEARASISHVDRALEKAEELLHQLV